VLVFSEAIVCLFAFPEPLINRSQRMIQMQWLHITFGIWIPAFQIIVLLKILKKMRMLSVTYLKYDGSTVIIGNSRESNMAAVLHVKYIFLHYASYLFL